MDGGGGGDGAAGGMDEGVGGVDGVVVGRVDGNPVQATLAAVDVAGKVHGSSGKRWRQIGDTPD